MWRCGSFPTSSTSRSTKKSRPAPAEPVHPFPTCRHGQCAITAIASAYSVSCRCSTATTSAPPSRSTAMSVPNTRRLNELKAGEEPRVIANALDTIERATGRRPVGWLGSGLQETWATVDLLAAEGCEYIADWVNDDQPYVMNLDGGRRLVSVPYSHEVNDKPAFERAHHTADEFKEIICRQFDVLYREGAGSGRVMAIAIHPYLTGVPHRIDAFDAALAYVCRHDGVWRATGSEIARHYLGQVDAVRTAAQ